MSRHVKGSLFADYVRMIRGHKNIDWAKHLEAVDLSFLVMKIDAEAWYPMETFERLGNAILREIGGGDVQSVRMWGRISVDALGAKYPSLVAEGDPVDTLRRFRVMRGTFFDFEAIEVTALSEGEATVLIHYHMGNMAEEAASYQTMGFFERLLEVGGADSVSARFIQKSWDGPSPTTLSINWITK